jgi:hypothetical protein
MPPNLSTPNVPYFIFSILPELTERADEIRQSLLAVPALADPQVSSQHILLRMHLLRVLLFCSFPPHTAPPLLDSLTCSDSCEQKLQEFLANAAKTDGRAGAGQGERSDVTVAALLGGVKRRGDVADEGEDSTLRIVCVRRLSCGVRASSIHTRRVRSCCCSNSAGGC